MEGNALGYPDLCNILYALSSLARTGWMLRGVPHQLAESVAIHSYYSAVIAFLIANRLAEKGVDVNVEKASLIALFHDMGEAFIGDVVKLFSMRIGELKEKIEVEVVKENLPSNISAYISEFSSQKSLEAKIARLAESLATYITAVYYRRAGFPVDDIMCNMLQTIRKICSELDLDLDEVERIIGCSIACL